MDKKRIVTLIKYGIEELEEFETEFSYNMGETIRINSETMYKCIAVEKTEDTVKFIFKEGIITFDW